MTLFETIEDQDKKLGELLKEQNTITEEQIDVVIEKADELNKVAGFAGANKIIQYYVQENPGATEKQA